MNGLYEMLSGFWRDDLKASRALVAEHGDRAPILMSVLFQKAIQKPRAERNAMAIFSQVYADAAALGEDAIGTDFSFVRFTHSKRLRMFTDVVDRATHGLFGKQLFDPVSMQQVFHTLAFRRAGAKTFQVAPGLGRELLDTDVRGLSTTDLHAPYEAFRIWVPPELGLRVWVAGTGWHPLAEVYAVRDGGSTRSGWRFLFHGLSKNNLAFDNAITFHGLYDEEDKPLEELAAEQQRLMAQHAEGYANDPEQTAVTNLRWAINVILYLTCTNVEREHRYLDPRAAKLVAKTNAASGKTRGKMKAKLRLLDRRQVIYLGGSVASRRSSEQTKLFRVRGHMHGYWTGEGLRKLSKEDREAKRSDLFKVKWVQPYWKGEGDESNPVVLMR